ncbi:PilN domain-containing protein [Defluviitalea saccharophila]|uniref:PilN domain-containing protein n=1 Tax=Defluviitalea saccharophila TaxID=879970 RepID=A0ABZ2Y3D6_9FIRM
MNKEYNFFYPYIQKSRRMARIRLGLIIALSVIIGSMFIIQLFTFLYSKEMKNKLSALENELSFLERNPDVQRYNETVRKYEILTQYGEIITNIDQSIQSTDVIDIELFNTLERCFPANMNITSLSLNMHELSIQGNGTSIKDIADLENNLRNNALFDRIHVSVINRNENKIAFSAACLIKDVRKNEAQ